MNSALIVEPDRSLRRTLVLLLGNRGWQVDAVESVEQAIELLSGPPRHSVYINETTDDDSGYLLLFAIRRHPRWRLARVVMAGTGDSTRHSACAAELGADGYLSQPFAAEQVLEKLTGDARAARPAPEAFSNDEHGAENFCGSIGRFRAKARTERKRASASAKGERRLLFP